jgi:hypothetical protein
MMDQKIKVEGEQRGVNLGFANVVFVLEDVDAASDVVQRRVGPPPSSGSSSTAPAAPLPSINERKV